MNSLAPLVDELGEIEAELLPYKAKIKRAEALRAAVRSAHKTENAQASFTIRGEKWLALLGACGNETIVHTALLSQRIGAEKFAALATVSLKALTEHCSAEVAGAVVTTQMSGSRPLSLVALAPAAAPAAAKKVRRAKTA